MNTPMLLVLGFTFVIHLISTLAYSVQLVGVKTGRDGQDVIRQVIAATVDILKSNADAVHDIAKKLKRHATLRGVRLATLLTPVSTSRSKFKLPFTDAIAGVQHHNTE